MNRADKGIENLKSWFRKIGAPVKLKDAGIPHKDIDRIAENAYNTALIWKMEKVYTKEVLTEILKNAND